MNLCGDNPFLFLRLFLTKKIMRHMAIPRAIAATPAPTPAFAPADNPLGTDVDTGELLKVGTREVLNVGTGELIDVKVGVVAVLGTYPTDTNCYNHCNIRSRER